MKTKNKFVNVVKNEKEQLSSIKVEFAVKVKFEKEDEEGKVVAMERYFK